jgi:hypothetical protein
MLRPLFFSLLFFALIGDARVFLFVANRVVFGSHREEKSRFHWLLYAVPPLLLVLTLLFWPLHAWIDDLTDERLAFLATLGAAWLFIAAAIGVYWILDRFRILLRGEPPVPGTRTLPAEVVKLRKAHIPFASLRKLGAHNDIYDLEITRHEVFVRNLPPSFDGYRVVFLTDTHVASFHRRAFFREVVAQANAYEPDLILLGGDFVTFERHIPLMAELLLSGLEARDGIYAVLGNHDYWANADGVVAAMTARGVRFIINRSSSIAARPTSTPHSCAPTRTCRASGSAIIPTSSTCWATAASTCCSAATRTADRSASPSSARWWCRRSTRRAMPPDFIAPATC